MKRLESIAFGVATIAFALPCAAQDGAVIATRRYFLDQATVAHAAGDHAQALDLARRAGQLRMTPSVRLFIAQEELALGQLAQALGDAEQCAADAARDVTAPQREEIESTCRQLVDSLRSRVGYVVVHTPAGMINGTAVTIAGTTIDPTWFDRPFIVTPGAVSVDLVFPGGRTAHRTLTVNAGATVPFDPAELPDSPEEDRPPPAPTAPPEATQTAPDPPAPAAPAALPASSGSSVGPIVLGGFGVASLIASGVLYGLMVQSVGNCHAVGDSLACPTQSDVDRARNAYGVNIAADVALGIGVAAAATAVTWWALTRGETPPRSITPGIAPTAGGAAVVLTGAF